MKRAPRGRTFAPWPCCNAPACETLGRPKKPVLCDTCRALLERARAQEARPREESETQPYWWPETDYAWPQFYSAECSHGPKVQRLSRAFWALVNEVTELAPLDTPTFSPQMREGKRWDGRKEQIPVPWPTMLSDPGHAHDTWSFLKLRLARVGVRARVDALHQAIIAALSETHQQAKELGGSVLLGLASGEKSMADFETAMLTREEQRRRK